MKGFAIGVFIGTMILGLGFSQNSFAYFEGSPYDQQEDGIPMEDTVCRDGRELMIDLRGKPGCAYDEHVEKLQGLGWTLVKQSQMAEEKEAMMEQKDVMMEKDEVMEEKEMTMIETEVTMDKDSMMEIGGIDISMAAPVEGEADAPITIIEFGEYQCPKCEQWYTNEKPTITTSLLDTGKAKLYFLDFAWLGDDSVSAAQATYCAGDQDMYHEYHSTLYTNQGGINDGWASPSELKNFAADIGLDTEMFNECLDSGKYAERVSYNTEVGNSQEVTGTPAFFLVSADGEVKRIDGPQPTSVFLGLINEFDKGY